jgi:hypothetical protein
MAISLVSIAARTSSTVAKLVSSQFGKSAMDIEFAWFSGVVSV